MPFQLRALDEVSDELEQLRLELSSWGLHEGGDRLAQIASHFQEIQDSVARGRAEELETRVDLEDYVWASVEALEFAEVYRALRPMDRRELSPLFEEVLVGPLHPAQELAGKTAKARNTMFQLRLGAGIRRAGYDVRFEDRSDLRVSWPSGQLFIECKRPYRGGKNIRDNVELARIQLQSALEGEPEGSSGLVAISVSRALNSGSRLLVADEPDGLTVLQDELQEIHRVLPRSSAGPGRLIFA